MTRRSRGQVSAARDLWGLIEANSDACKSADIAVRLCVATLARSFWLSHLRSRLKRYLMKLTAHESAWAAPKSSALSLAAVSSPRHCFERQRAPKSRSALRSDWTLSTLK